MLGIIRSFFFIHRTLGAPRCRSPGCGVRSRRFSSNKELALSMEAPYFLLIRAQVDKARLG